MTGTYGHTSKGTTHITLTGAETESLEWGFDGRPIDYATGGVRSMGRKVCIKGLGIEVR